MATCSPWLLTLSTFGFCQLLCRLNLTDHGVYKDVPVPTPTTLLSLAASLRDSVPTVADALTTFDSCRAHVPQSQKVSLDSIWEFDSSTTLGMGRHPRLSLPANADQGPCQYFGVESGPEQIRWCVCVLVSAPLLRALSRDSSLSGSLICSSSLSLDLSLNLTLQL